MTQTSSIDPQSLLIFRPLLPKSVSQIPWPPASISENRQLSSRVVHLLSSPPVQITIPEGPVSSDKVPNLLKEVAIMVSEAVTTKIKDQRKELFENGYRKGVGAALLICNSSFGDDMTNGDLVDSQPDCSPFVKETLRRMAGLSPSIKQDPILWEKTTFLNANSYIRQFDLHQREKVMGYLDDRRSCYYFGWSC